MAQINYGRREIACKIVYYGPGMSGKTTNLEQLYKMTPSDYKGELTSIATEGDRTLFFDYMPLSLGNIRGMNIKFQLYTVPGQVYYNSTRKLVLRGVDGVIFVADSGKEKMDTNIESLNNLEENLREYGLKIEGLPLVLQYNKRDLPDAMDVSLMNEKLNRWNVRWFEAVALEGKGISDCLKALAGKVIESLQHEKSPKEFVSAVPSFAATSSQTHKPGYSTLQTVHAKGPTGVPVAASATRVQQSGHTEIQSAKLPGGSSISARLPRKERGEDRSLFTATLFFLLVLLGILGVIIYFQIQ